MRKITCDILNGNCEDYLKDSSELFDLTFLDPPFNQGKEYRNHNDSMTSSEYWNMMKRVCSKIYDHTTRGGAIYFMQREKNTAFVLDALSSTGWTFQNLIIWKKKTSAVPNNYKFGLHYQIIAFFTKGNVPRVFNKLRIDPPLLKNQNYSRTTGMFVTDVWDDIRELTSGYFAGDEPIRSSDGQRVHKQQSPLQLLARIILSSSNPGNMVFDPFAGTGTTLVVSKQLLRKAIGIEVDPVNVQLVKKRISHLRTSDRIERFRREYEYTNNLNVIWPSQNLKNSSLDAFNS